MGGAEVIAGGVGTPALPRVPIFLVPLGLMKYFPDYKALYGYRSYSVY